MHEILYDRSSLLIACVLLALMAVAMELGYRIGMRGAARTSEAARAQVGTVQSSLLGILALMLGFTFSIALERYNTRSAAVVNEANAIGTAFLRSGLLPERVRDPVRAVLREYTDLRVRASAVDSARRAELQPLLDEAARVQAQLWNHAAEAARLDPNPVTSGLFVQSVNELIDAHGTRIAEIDRHVPEFVLVLLYGAFVLSGGMIGYTAGLSGHRPARATHAMVWLIVLLIFMVIDLDRPRHGLIRVSQQSLVDLKASIGGADRPAAGSVRRP